VVYLFFYGSDTLIAKPSQIIIGGYYTTNDQYSISINPEMYFFSNDLYISAPLSYGYNVTRFYGIGPSTPDTGNVNYTSKVVSGTLTILGPSIWLTADKAGLVFDYNYTEIVDKEDNQYLLNDEVLGSNGGDYGGVGVNAVWDTRNNIFYPTDGKYSSIKFMSYPVGDFIYYTTELDVKSYSSISKDRVFAGEVYFNNSVGNVPFYALPQLGGQYKMRGYYQGRYVDNAYFTMQVEYRRANIWWRFGYVVFASVGTVAPSPDKYQISEMKLSYGAGLRFLFNEKEGVNLRMDIGITREGETGVYFGIGEAF
jgi:outer membrane protein assembly factor BamA